jgi:hypothetical protein
MNYAHTLTQATLQIAEWLEGGEEVGEEEGFGRIECRSQ